VDILCGIPAEIAGADVAEIGFNFSLTISLQFEISIEIIKYYTHTIGDSTDRAQRFRLSFADSVL
jgi:predicted nucleic acid-binding protein